MGCAIVEFECVKIFPNAHVPLQDQSNICETFQKNERKN